MGRIPSEGDERPNDYEQFIEEGTETVIVTAYDDQGNEVTAVEGDGFAEKPNGDTIVFDDENNVIHNFNREQYARLDVKVDDLKEHLENRS